MRKFLPFLFALTPATTLAAQLVVDTSSDNALVACTAAANDCSLRGAISVANQTPALDEIVFNLAVTDPGFQSASGHWLIEVGNSLPLIEEPVIIDGYSQPGASPNTRTPEQGGLDGVLKIELRPSGSSASQPGLGVSPNNFAQAASVIRGLAISRFATQIDLTGDGAHRIEGCYLGTNITGTAASLTGNSGLGSGVRLGGPGDYVIGGLQPAARNLIGGLLNAIVSFSSNDGVQILGNLIGTDALGSSAIRNRQNGFQSTGLLTNSQIGGTDPAARNVFSANDLGAIYLSTSGSDTAYAGTRIEGNYFGTDVSGRFPIGNGFNPSSPSQTLASVYFFKGGACNIEVGGLAPGAANLIAFSGGAGIQASTCSGVTLRGNVFHGNRGPAIDDSFSSNADGATANDAGDADEGGNRLQNTAVISVPADFLPSGASTLDLSYVVDTAVANAAYPLVVDFFRAGCGGGGATLLASDTYGPADAQQPRNFSLVSTDGANVLPLTALVTDSAGNTSEFSVTIGETLFVDGFEDEPATFSIGSCGPR